MKITVAIPAYKPNYLKEAIQSVIDQSYQDWELVIVNDCSPYDLNSIINCFNDTRIKYYTNEINIGGINVVDNWNKCLEYATGDYIMLIGDDDKLPKESLKNYIDIIGYKPGLDIYHGRTILIDENSEVIYIQESRPSIESLYSAIWHRMDGRQQFIGDYLFKVDTLRNNNGFVKIPLAWGSDDISVYKAIADKGIANTNEPSFYYRVNRYSITSSGNSDIKINATYIHKKYLKEFLINTNALGTDEILRKLALKRIENYFTKKRIHIVAVDIASKGFFRIFRWLAKRKLIELPWKYIIYALVESIKLKR